MQVILSNAISARPDARVRGACRPVLEAREGCKHTGKDDVFAPAYWSKNGTVCRPLLVLILVAGLWSCDGDTRSPTAPDLPPPAAELSVATINAMREAIQEEYFSFFTYSGVVADFGAVLPFDLIDDAEQRHVDAIGMLFTWHGLDVPTSLWDGANTPEFDVLVEACEAGREIELATISMYQESLRLDLPQDVRTVFQNLLTASVEQHLPAFETCLNRPR